MGRIIILRLQPDGYQPFPMEADKFDDALIQIGRGTYTVFRLYSKDRVLHLTKHFDRLRRSAGLIGMPFLHSDHKLRETVRQAVRAVDVRPLRICLMVPVESPELIFVMLDEFQPISEINFRRGIRVGVKKIQREQPDAKDSSFVNIRQQLKSEQQDFNDILQLEEQENIL